MASGAESPMDTSEANNGPNSPVNNHDMHQGPWSPDGPASPQHLKEGPASPTCPASPDMLKEQSSPMSGPQSPDSPKSALEYQAATPESGQMSSDESVGSPSGQAVHQQDTANGMDKANSGKKSSANLDLSKVHDDHGELDFDEDFDDIEEKEKAQDDKDKAMDIKNEEGELKEEGEAKSDGSDDGQLSDNGSEEGEIKETDDEEDFKSESEEPEPAKPVPQRRPQITKPMPGPVCRFFERGSCTWGMNCRFLHPGVNDHVFDGPPRRGWPEEKILPPPPAVSPPQESAWERGLRHAKKLRELANKRKEEEPDFEEKRMTLSIEDDKSDYNKENERKYKEPYHEQVFEDDYYDHERQTQESWGRGEFENFEVRWPREEGPVHPPPPQRHMYNKNYGPPPHQMQQQHYRQERFSDRDEFGRDRFPPRDQRRFPTPPERRFADIHMFRGRGGRGGGGGGGGGRDFHRYDNREAYHEHDPAGRHHPGMEEGGRGGRGDEWKDPWARGRSPKRHYSESPPRHRRRYRSRSGSYSSSSYSRSRSRSRSSYSSYSRSSYSRSSSYSSRSRSRSIPAAAKRPPGYRPPNHQAFGQKPSDTPRSAVNKPAPPQRQQQQQQQPIVAPHHKQQTKKPSVGGVKMVVKKPEKPQLAPQPPPQQQLKSQPMTAPMPGNKKDQPLPGRSRMRDRQAKLKRGSGFSSSSSESGSSTSRSTSTSSTSTTVSSGSADSDNLYRDIKVRSKGVRPSPSPKKRDHRKELQAVPVRIPHSPDRRQPREPPAREMSRQKSKSTSQPAAIKEVRESKDLMKLSGQKTGIKLTLVNKSERPKSRPDKRMSASALDEPPAKRMQRSPVKDSRSRGPDIRSPKMRQEMPKAAKPPPVVPMSPVKQAPPKKKSATNRREELLKQLKAVENAIARKRHKMS